MVEEIIQTQGKKKKIMPFDIFVVLFMLIIVITTIYLSGIPLLYH